MNKQTIAGRWTQFKGVLLEQWGRFKHDGRLVAAGRRDQMLGRISVAQGAASQQIEQQLREWRERNATFLAEHARLRRQPRALYN